MSQPQTGALVLKDGSVFEGEIYGELSQPVLVSGEVVFNTVLCGYQEVITDPSYAGQIVTFTYPHIGNYGTFPQAAESRKPFCRGVIVRDIQESFSNWKAEKGLLQYLQDQKLPVISGIDTRRLTRHIRDAGAMPGAFGTASEGSLLKAAQAEPGTDGIDLVKEVTCQSSYKKPASTKKALQVIALDFGIKSSILSQLQNIAALEVVPAHTAAEKILSKNPDGVFLSNGPGDPDCVGYAKDLVQKLLGQVPVFGICLGFQFLCQALGAKTYKLPFGHHGGNHPVKRIAGNEIEITSQNHNFAVDPDSLSSDITVTHINLNDQTLEGILAPKLKAMGVQYHPEAGPGPHDSRYLFHEFQEMMNHNPVKPG